MRALRRSRARVCRRGRHLEKEVALSLLFAAIALIGVAALVMEAVVKAAP